MIPSWNDPETQDLWTLTTSEIALLPGMTDKGRLGFAVQLKFMQVHGRFPERHDEIDPSVAQGLAAQLGTTADALSAYELNGRQGQRHRRTIRVFLGFRPTTGDDLQQLDQWLYREVLPVDPQARHGRDAALDWCRAHRLEPPVRDHLDRVIRSAVYRYETRQQSTIHARLSAASQAAIDRLLEGDEPETDAARVGEAVVTSLSHLKTDPGKPNLESLLATMVKLECIDGIGLSPAVFHDVPSKLIDPFRQRCTTESIRDLRRHPPTIRYSLVATFCWRRRQQLTDALVDLLLQVIHNLGARAEKRIDQRHFAAFKKVRGKARLLFKVAEATVDQPEGVIKEVVYPVVAQKTLQALVAEFKATDFDFEREVQTTLRSSYSHHYRCMLMPVLGILSFQSNNAVHRPVIQALEVLKANRDHSRPYYTADEAPLDGVIAPKWRDIVMEQDPASQDRVHRINYEICVLRTLRKRLRTKEIWVDGADRYRNPEHDLPTDFAAQRDHYYQQLQMPRDAEAFIHHLQTTLRQWLATLNGGLPENPKVRLRQQGQNLIHLTPLERQPDPPIPPCSSGRSVGAGRMWS